MARTFVNRQINDGMLVVGRADASAVSDNQENDDGRSQGRITDDAKSAGGQATPFGMTRAGLVRANVTPSKAQRTGCRSQVCNRTVLMIVAII